MSPAQASLKANHCLFTHSGVAAASMPEEAAEVLVAISSAS